MSDLSDLLSTTRYEHADPPTLREAELSRDIWTLLGLLAERATDRRAIVLPMHARR